MSSGIPLFISRKMDLKILLTYFAAINIITFIVYARDKRLAKKPNARRIPEKTLLLLAAIGGSIGALIAMYTLRHKTLHKKFFLGVPAILIIQIAIILYLHLK